MQHQVKCKVSKRKRGSYIGLHVGEPRSETRFRMNAMPRKLEVVLVAVRLPGEQEYDIASSRCRAELSSENGTCDKNGQGWVVTRGLQ